MTLLPFHIVGGVLVPVFAMLYWLWRIRGTQTLQGVVSIRDARMPALEKL